MALQLVCVTNETDTLSRDNGCLSAGQDGEGRLNNTNSNSN